MVKLAEKSMTDLQREVLLYINCNDSSTSLHTYSWYVRELSRRMGIPESTAKWTLNGLRECMLIEAGSASMRGVPLRLTYPGLLVAEKISKRSRPDAKRLEKEIMASGAHPGY